MGRFLRWWYCADDKAQIYLQHAREMSALKEAHDHDTVALAKAYAEREAIIIESHRTCHSQMAALGEEMTDRVCDVYGRLEEFSEKIRKTDRTTEADRLMEVADGLLWALNQKVGLYQHNRNMRELESGRIQ